MRASQSLTRGASRSQLDLKAMAEWGELDRLRPDLTEAGARLFYQFGPGLAFLATCRPDGGPRVHPMCPLLTRDGLFAFIIPSPKRDDLLRDGRYAMHSFGADNNEDAFYVTGRAQLVTDEEPRMGLAAQYAREREVDEPPPELVDQMLFAFDVETCLLTRTTGHGDPAPEHSVWHSHPRDDS